jgi:hypothetical protein
MSQPNYRTSYQPLDRNARSIRLLEIGLADDESDPVSCRLISVSLDERPSYYALSYVWGDPQVTTPVILDRSKVLVTTNLELALRHLRQQRRLYPRRLWADALCINQNDIGERSHQVGLMKDIYSKAIAVFAWLGPDEDGRLGEAFRIARLIDSNVPLEARDFNNINWIENHPDLCRCDDNERIPNRLWRMVSDLGSHPYWTRAWILQEIVLARMVWVLAGHQIIEYGELHALRLFFDAIWYGSVPPPSVMQPTLWYQLGLITADIGRLAMPHWLRSAEVQRRRGDGALIELMMDFIGHRATDARDKVFAVQGLTGTIVPPDYTMDVSEVYCKLATRLVALRSSKGYLYSLIYAGKSLHANSQIDLPSWVPDWQSLVDRRPVQMPDQDVNGGFEPGSGPTVLIGHRLQAGGVVWDTVNQVFPAPKDWRRETWQLVVRSFNEDLLKTYPTGIPYVQALFRTLLAYNEHAISGHNESIPPRIQREYLSAFLLLALMQDGRTRPLEDLIQWATGELGIGGDRPMISFLTLLFPGATIGDPWVSPEFRDIFGDKIRKPNLTSLGLVGMSKLFITTRGYMGFVYKYAEISVGDAVCVLRDCYAPVILRQVDSHFIHVCTCFLLGLEGGAAAKGVQSGRPTLQTFEIH